MGVVRPLGAHEVRPYTENDDGLLNSEPYALTPLFNERICNRLAKQTCAIGTSDTHLHEVHDTHVSHVPLLAYACVSTYTGPKNQT